MFLKNMLPLMSVLQFLFIALAPLAAFTLVMAGSQGMAMFVKYIMFGLWTQSWLPVAALLNDYSQITLTHSLAALGQATTGIAANMMAAIQGPNLGSLTPPVNAMTVQTIPLIIEQTMQSLSNANMLMALTPIITMVVFTGSYMGMAQLAQDMGGEDKVDRNTVAEAPSVGSEVKSYGVSAPGNATGSYISTDGMTSGLGFSVGNTASMASTAARSAAATATESATQATTHAASMAYDTLSQSGVEQTAAFKSQDQGSREISTAFGHAQKFEHNAKVSMDTAFAMQAAYNGQLKIPGMTPQSAWASLASGAFSGVIGGLKGQAKDELKKGIQNNDVQGWANTLSSGEAAKFVQSVSRENSKAISQKQADKVDQSVNDAQRQEASAQQAVAHAAKVEEQASSMRSVGGNAKVDQSAIASYFAQRGEALTSPVAQMMAMRAGGIDGAVALHKAEEQLSQSGLRGEALEAAALTKIGMMNPETGLGIASQIFGDMGPGLKGAGDLKQEVGKQIAQTQGEVDKAKAGLVGAGNNAKDAERAANQSKNSGAANKPVPTITSTSPTTDPHAFASQGQAAIVSNHSKDVGPTRAFTDGMAAVNNAPGMKLLQSVSPNEFLGLLVGGNAVSGALGNLEKNLAEKKMAERLGQKSGGGGPDKPGGGGAPEPDGKPSAPDKPDGKPSAPPEPGGEPPKGASPAPESPAPEGGAKPTSGAATAAESATPDYAARQQAARDALNPVQRAETVATDAGSLAEKRLAAKAGADAALSVADQAVLQEAKQAILQAGEKFAAKTAVGTAVAAGAASTGVGAPIAGVIEVANVAMNASAAVDVAQALYTYAKTPGASEEVASALRSTANSIMEKAGKPLDPNVPNVVP